MLSFVPDLITRFAGRKKGCLDMLSDDILVDHIFIYFSVEEILSIRRVSRLYYYLTHHPVIWKRFLRRMRIPLPPLPPISRYSLGQLSAEAERLVVRAISLDDNWRDFRPQLFHVHRLKVYSRVHGMAVLPGGKYLVASVDSGSRHYSLMVFALDDGGGQNVALAKTPTMSKAYHLQAKYMTYQNVQGIAIAYARRKFKGNHRDRCGIDPSDYSPATEIDSPFPLQYECVCLHISLESLELLSDPSFPPGSAQFREHAESQPPPFRELARIRSSDPLDSLTLVEHTGLPFLAFVQKPNKIVIKDLTHDAISTLKCEPYEPMADLEQTICRMHIFPEQHQILVIRSVPPPLPGPDATPVYLFEMYDTPDYGKIISSQAVDRYTMDNRHIVGFYISDANLVNHNDESIQPTLHAAQGPPPPISIFCRTIEPNGLHHFILWPQHFYVPAGITSVETSLYFYTLSNMISQSRHDSDDVICCVLPGSSRSLIYTISADDRRATPSLIELRRYVSPETQPFEYPEPQKEDTSDIMKERKRVPFNIYSTLELPRNLAKTLRNHGITAVAWDEGLGRVCIAASEDSTIHILDFSQVSKLIPPPS